MAAPLFGALNPLSLSADWESQPSSGALARTLARQAGADGDFVAEQTHNPIESGTALAIYKGTEAGYIAALADYWPGKLAATSTLLLTQVSVDWNPCAAGKKPQVEWTFRDGPTAAPATPFWYKTDLVLPTYAAAVVKIPTLLTVTAGSAECVSCKWTLAMQFDPDINKDGNFLSGDGYGGEERIDLTFAGIPTSITSTGWMEVSANSTKAPNSTNTGYAQNSYSFTRKVTRATS